MENQKTQVVERVAKILAEISKQGMKGSRLKDIALDTGIARPSVHRILNELIDVDFITQLSDKRYVLGSALFSLGLSAPSPIHDMKQIRELAQALADQCGDVVYIGLRQFNGVHYLVRAEGAYPIRTHLVSAGDTKPFTASYSGIALLAHMNEDEQRIIVNRMELDAPEEWVKANRNHLEQTIKDKIADVKTLGYCAGRNIVMPGIAGMAAPITSATQAPYMTVSISAVEGRLNIERVKELAPLLLQTAMNIREFID